MKITIKLHNDWDRPYFYTGESPICRHVETDSWTTDDRELAMKIVRDQLDVPEAEMTLDQVKADFADGSRQIEESKFVAIQNYYNGRLALYNRIMDEIETAGPGTSSRYDIPYEYNHFEIEDEEGAAKETQREAYIEISFSAD